MSNTKKLRILLYILAAAVVVIPIIIVGITGNGFGEIVSQALVSLSIALTISATLLGTKRQDKTFYFRIGTCIGLGIVLISLWI